MVKLFADILEYNALRDVQQEPLNTGGLVKRIMDLPRALTRPAPTFTEGGQRRRARFLRTALFVAVFAFPILQITSEPIQGYPLYSLLTFFIAGVYLLSGTEHLRLASAIAIICAASLPFITILINPVWPRGLLAMQIMTWPVLAVLIGSQLLPLKKQSLLVGGITIGLLLLSIWHPGIVFRDGIELIAVYLAISVLLVFTSWTQDYYSTGLERINKDLAARRRELEIYTSLLRHDLINDVQMILGGIELAMISNGEPKQAAFLDSTLAAAQRMKSLLHIFSVSEAELDADIFKVIEKIGKRAEIAFKGMHVSISATDDVRQEPPKYGRLVALAFENLLRNASQHAGDNPNVEIMISRSGETLEVHFADDGPGIDPVIRENLFGKGVSTGPEGKGLGLYLAKIIFESERGTIDLLPMNDPGCCFLIKLPFDNGN
ncbi:MAG: sensor histidine kinase [Candidatus Thorarchaeota archaeon]|jgi:signal transduction histidine kinase